jgi:electron transfer DM13
MEMLRETPAPPKRRSLVARHPWLAAIAALAGAAAIAVPVVAFVIVPALVRSTLTESLPVASAPAAGSPTAPAVPTQVLAQGELRRLDAAHFGSGKVLIADVNGTRYLRFENVEIAGAPDVYVYLSDRTDGQPGRFTNLGKLKATNGSFNYTIPADLDLTQVKSVVAWCRPFNVTITFALLEKG